MIEYRGWKIFKAAPSFPFAMLSKRKSFVYKAYPPKSQTWLFNFYEETTLKRMKKSIDREILIRKHIL